MDLEAAWPSDIQIYVQSELFRRLVLLMLMIPVLMLLVSSVWFVKMSLWIVCEMVNGEISDICVDADISILYYPSSSTKSWCLFAFLLAFLQKWQRSLRAIADSWRLSQQSSINANAMHYALGNCHQTVTCHGDLDLNKNGGIGRWLHFQRRWRWTK